MSWTAILQSNFEFFKKTEEKLSCKIEILLTVNLVLSPSLSECNRFCSDHLRVGEADPGAHPSAQTWGVCISKQFKTSSRSLCHFYPFGKSMSNCNCTVRVRPSDCDGLCSIWASKVWTWIQRFILLMQCFISVSQNECVCIYTHVCICTHINVYVLIIVLIYKWIYIYKLFLY